MTAPGTIRVSIDASAVPANPAGAGRYVIDLVAALRRRADTELTVICRQGDEVRWRAGGSGRPVLGAAPARRPLRLAWEQARLPRLLNRLPVDVHHSPHYTMPERAQVPCVVTVHDLTFLENPSWHEPVKVAFFRRALRVAATRADALIAVSAATATRLEAVLSPKAPIHVIPHGVDAERLYPCDPADFEAGEADRATRRGLAVEGPYLLFVGTIEPRKDVPSLVRAFDRLAATHPDVTLVLAGAPGWGTAAVDEAIASAVHNNRIQRLGYVSEDEKAALLKGAAAVAYPSLEEGFGLPALEALACGVPLVTTSGSAMEEIVGPAALLVEPGDIGALTDAIEAVIGGGADVDRRRLSGLEIASRYTWEASAAAHTVIYRSVM
ncbi:MAG: glycosyltransferase family 4 protein [Actinomycetota bacterium]|nr:glycosyltransferase family 4 protein [Actinomycetota bacterium]